MTDIPQAALDAAARACPFTNRDAICRILEAAEAVWPHNPPTRDPASTTSLVTDRSWTAARQARGTAFGFGKDATATASDHYLGGASLAEDIRDERWEDATS